MRSFGLSNVKDRGVTNYYWTEKINDDLIRNKVKLLEQNIKWMGIDYAIIEAHPYCIYLPQVELQKVRGPNFPEKSKLILR